MLLYIKKENFEQVIKELENFPVSFKRYSEILPQWEEDGDTLCWEVEYFIFSDDVNDIYQSINKEIEILEEKHDIDGFVKQDLKELLQVLVEEGKKALPKRGGSLGSSNTWIRGKD